MNSRNPIVRNYYWRLFSDGPLAGKKRKVEWEKPYKGGPRPLLKNVNIRGYGYFA